MGIFKRNRYDNLSDEELFSHMKNGEERAFKELYGRYSKKMLFFFYQRLNNDNERAQDLLQDLFLKIIEKPESFDKSRKFSVWIYVVASNMCKHSLTFVLKHQQGLTIKEISDIMDCSEGTVKSRLFYSIKKLSNKLQMYNFQNEKLL